jgi:hypothetical protein
MTILFSKGVLLIIDIFPFQASRSRRRGRTGRGFVAKDLRQLTRLHPLRLTPIRPTLDNLDS